MTTPASNLSYHLLEFDRTREAAAFVAALSRFLDSSRGEVYLAQSDPMRVLRRATTTGGISEVYLSEEALKAATSAFAPVPVAGACHGEALPSGCVSIIGDHHPPAWGLEDAERCFSSTETPQMPIRERMKADLLKAMKARRKITVTTLRSVLAAIDNAEAVEPNTSSGPIVGRSADVPRKVLTEKQMRDILESEAAERRSAIAEYERLDRHTDANRLRLELEVLATYSTDSDLDVSLGAR